MQAVIETGGKQYQVAEGDMVDVELLGKEPGEAVEFDRVLMVKDGSATRIGAPIVVGAKVCGEVVEIVKADKVVIMKYRRRKDSQVKKGHRQKYARVKITTVAA
jgi:large subunit ribosomal protein L21